MGTLLILESAARLATALYYLAAAVIAVAVALLVSALVKIRRG